jgi:hypothetical protein
MADQLANFRDGDWGFRMTLRLFIFDNHYFARDVADFGSLDNLINATASKPVAMSGLGIIAPAAHVGAKTFILAKPIAQPDHHIWYKSLAILSVRLPPPFTLGTATARGRLQQSVRISVFSADDACITPERPLRTALAMALLHYAVSSIAMAFANEPVDVRITLGNAPALPVLTSGERAGARAPYAAALATKLGKWRKTYGKTPDTQLLDCVLAQGHSAADHQRQLLENQLNTSLAATLASIGMHPVHA